MSFDLIKIIEEMNGFQMGIVTALTLLGLASLTVFFERLWVYASVSKRSREFAQSAATLLNDNKVGDLVNAADASQAPFARIVAAGLKAHLAAMREGHELDEAVALASREVTRRRDAVDAQMRRGMPILATTGSLAPFIGLLGTVVGIISAFQGIAKEGSAGLGAVSAGIAEALVVTAYGLLIAIPAVLLFNVLTARAESVLLSLDQSSGEFLDFLKVRRVGRPNQ